MLLGLAAPRRLLAALGDPHQHLSAVLIGGTNGKGSTSALLAAMTAAAGSRTGLYTSPHLEHVEERIRIDGRAVEGGSLGSILEEVIAVASGLAEEPPTYFEALTVAAFLHFRREDVELAVIEVGLGGARDATNTVEPELSVLTPIAKDHREMLGDTLEEIAREKAGILRPGIPALAAGGGQRGKVRRILTHAAAEAGASLAFVEDEVEILDVASGSTGLAVSLRTPKGRYEIDLPLAGRHQALNLTLAVRAAEMLERDDRPLLTREAIVGGAEGCSWPGRLETVALPEGAVAGERVLLDAAHNPAGVASLVDHLDQRPLEGDRSFDLLFGVLAEKDAAAMLGPLAERARRITLTRPPGGRGRDPEELRAFLPEGKEAKIEGDPGRALTAALSGAKSTLVVCGSIYLIGQVRKDLRRRFGVPAPTV